MDMQYLEIMPTTSTYTFKIDVVNEGTLVTFQLYLSLNNLLYCLSVCIFCFPFSQQIPNGLEYQSEVSQSP